MYNHKLKVGREEKQGEEALFNSPFTKKFIVSADHTDS